MLINLDRVGDFGSEPDDVILLGKCDDIVAQLCRALGWEAELIKLWKKTEFSVDSVADTDATGETNADGGKAAVAEENVDSLVERIGKSLAINDVADTISKKQEEQASSQQPSTDPKGPHYAPAEKNNVQLASDTSAEATTESSKQTAKEEKTDESTPRSDESKTTETEVKL